MKIIKILIFYILTVFFIFLLSKFVDYEKVIGYFLSINIYFVILAVTLGVIQSVISAVRLKNLFKIINAKKITLTDIWVGGWISAMVSLFVPFYAGGFLYAKILAKKGVISYLKSFSILFLDFLINLVYIFTFGTLGAVYFGFEKPVIIFLFLLLLVTISIYIFRKKILIISFNKAKNYKYILISFALGLITNLFSFTQIYLFFLAFGLKVNISLFFLTQSLFNVINILPGAPLKFGQFELTGILTFSYLLGFDQSLISAIFSLQHIVSIAMISLIGIFTFLVVTSHSN